MKRFLLLVFFFIIRFSFCQIPNRNMKNSDGSPIAREGPDSDQIFGNDIAKDSGTENTQPWLNYTLRLCFRKFNFTASLL